MIKFSHSVFAMPFALASFFLAARSGGIEPMRLCWVVVAMIGARSAAMGVNRWADAEIDAKNPRTSGREIPAGILSKGHVVVFVVISGLALVAASSQLNPLCFALSPVALVTARAAHLLALACLLLLPAFEPLHHASYFAGLTLVGALFAYEHSIVKADDLSRIDAAFFTVNGWVGVLYFVTVVVAGSLT